jgi:hypothetical protein
MITFKQYLHESSDELSTIHMIAGMYKNLNINVQQVYIQHIKSRYNGMKNCFYNAEMTVKKNKTAKYVLGFIIVHGVPLEHAWIKLASGDYIDTTINTPEKYSYYSCLELTNDELLNQIKHTKSKPGYIDLSVLNRYTKKL